ncbi:MAG: hypothetical protein V7776_10820 [Halopseudomonas aestusnigri]
MVKKLSLFLSISILTILLLELSTAQNSWAVELSPYDCPVNLGEKIAAQLNEQDCQRRTDPSNKNYAYRVRWKWNDYLSYGEAVYFPLKPKFYWEKASKVKKDKIKDWHELRNVRASNVKDLKCSGYTCFIFADPTGDGHCLFYQRDFYKGDKFSDHARASSLLFGYNCDTGKQNSFTPQEVKEFLGAIEAK